MGKNKIINNNCAKSFQLCLTLWDTMDCSSHGSSAHEILQARILEWVAMLSSRESSWPKDQTTTHMSPVFAGGFFTTSTTWEALWWLHSLRICLQCGEPRFNPWVGKIPCRREWRPTPYSCLENPMDNPMEPMDSPWIPKELDTTERINHNSYVLFTY